MRAYGFLVGLRTAAGEVGEELRRKKGLTLLDIAVAGGTNPTMVLRFEKGVAGWDATERLVDVYVRECGVSVREFWLMAVDRM